MTQKILVLAANPKTTSPLRLDKEIREIDEGLRRSKNRAQFVLVQRLAVQTEDLRRACLDEEPYLVHFCGHGTGEEGILLEDGIGNPQLVKSEALANLFKLFSNQIECVILNACYSEVQTEAISQHIKYVIGMKEAIGDESAISFSTGFYDAIGAGKSIEEAFEFGKNAISFAHLPEELIPVIKKNGVHGFQQQHIEPLQPQTFEISKADHDSLSLPASEAISLEGDKDQSPANEMDITSVVDKFPLLSRRSVIFSIMSLLGAGSVGVYVHGSVVTSNTNTLPVVPENLLKLRELLQTRKWKEANLETLKVMVEALGRKGEKPLVKKEDLENFPCNLLQVIDQLWVTASNGRFGFSIQSKIYMECGGKFDGKHDRDIWKCFAKRVEWYVDGEWRDWYWFRVHLTNTHLDSAPVGYLPWWWISTSDVTRGESGSEMPLWCAGPQIMLCAPKYYWLDDQTGQVWLGWMAALVLRLSECKI
jgi:GUN4-like/CHAT domain